MRRSSDEVLPGHEVGRFPPEVTVVIPTRDRWPLLSTVALPGALRQEDVALEVIVVDDGSSDETPAGLAALEEPRLRVLRHERSLGPARARNTGIAAAAGEWLAFLDDDDLWSPRKLRAQLDTANAAGADFVYAGGVLVDESATVIGAEPAPGPDRLEARLLRANRIPGGCSNTLARTDLVRRLGGFDERLFHLADWDLWLRLAGAATAAACSDVLVAHTEHAENMFARDKPDALTEFDYFVDKHRPRMPTDVGHRHRFVQWLADEQFRSGHPLRASRLYLHVAVRTRSLGNLASAIGALLGRRGMELTRGLVARLRSHGAVEGTSELVEPGWLSLYRTHPAPL